MGKYFCRPPKYLRQQNILSEEHPDILGPEGHVDVEQLLNSQRIGLLIAHHGHIVKSIKVGESLQICLVLYKLLSASVKKANVGVSSCHCLTIQLKDQPEHTVAAG